MYLPSPGHCFPVIWSPPRPTDAFRGATRPSDSFGGAPRPGDSFRGAARPSDNIRGAGSRPGGGVWCAVRPRGGVGGDSPSLRGGGQARRAVLQVCSLQY